MIKTNFIEVYEELNNINDSETLGVAELEETIIWVAFQSDAFSKDGFLSIYAATTSPGKVNTLWNKAVRKFYRTGPDDITKLFLAEIKCTSDDATILLDGANAVNATFKTSAEYLAAEQTIVPRIKQAEKLLSTLIDQGKAEEIKVEYGG